MSNIDPTKPTYGQAFTSDVRQNFSTAKTEIETLQSTTDALPGYIGGSIAAAVANYVPLTQKAAPLGVATLDTLGKLVTTQIPAAFTGTMNYRGGWNAATNTPVLATGGLVGGVASVKGDYFVVTVGATTAAIDGTTVWVSGDWAMSSGTTWQRVQNSTGPYILLTGGTATGTVNAPTFGLAPGGDTWTSTGLSVDYAWHIRDATGGIPLAILQDGTTSIAAVPAPTTNLMPINQAYADAHYFTTTGGTLTGSLNITGGLTTAGPLAFPGSSSFGQPLEANLAFSIRDGNGNICLGIDTSGQVNIASLTGGASFPALTVNSLTYTDLTSSGIVGADNWLSNYSYDLTISDGVHIAGGILKDGRLRVSWALPTFEITVPLSGLSNAYQLDASVCSIVSCVAAGGVQLKRMVGSVWFIQNSCPGPINVWPPTGGQFGVSAVNAFITLEAGSAIIIWQVSANEYGVMAAGSGGGGGAGYVFTGTGFTNPRDMHDRVADTVNVMDLVAGIDLTGVNDNSTQIKAAHDLAFGMGYRYLWFPARSKINAPFGIPANTAAAPQIYEVIFVGENCTINTLFKVIADPHGKSFAHPTDDLTPIMMEPFNTVVRAATKANPARVVIIAHSGAGANGRQGNGGTMVTLLAQKLYRAYGNRPIDVVDRNIGGTGWIDMARNGPPQNHYGNDTNNPAWWAQYYETNHPGTNYNRRWIDFILDLQPVHAIFIQQGANDNKNFDIYCMQAFLDEVKARFNPIPIIFGIADYGRKMQDSFSGTYDTTQIHEYNQLYQRTYWRRNGVGFFDFGRATHVLRDGFDPVGGTMKNFIDGFAISDGGNNNQVTAQPLPWSFPADKLTSNGFAFRIGPNGNMSAFFGSKKLIVQIGNETENILILEQDVSGKLAYTVQSINHSNTLLYGRDPTWPPPTSPYLSIPRTITTFDLTVAGNLTIELDIREGMMNLQLTSKSGATFTQPVLQTKVQIDRYGGYFLPNIKWDNNATSPAVTLLQASIFVPDQYIPQMTDEEFLPAVTLHTDTIAYTKLLWPVINAARFV